MEIQKPPKAILCYICGKEYKSKAIETHLAKCRDNWNRAQELKPEEDRLKCPESPLGFSQILNGQFERGQSVMSQITATLNEEKSERDSDEEAKTA